MVDGREINEPTGTKVDLLRRAITDEIFIALGYGRNSWQRRRLGFLFRAPAQRFAELSANWDARVAEGGLHKGAAWLQPRFVETAHVVGAENIPSSGPLLIASNHPGVIDGVVIMANLGRDDIKLVLSGIPFTRALTATRPHLIYSTLDTHDRMAVVRSSLRHLRQGGSLLIFPAGRLEPDPAILRGAEQSLENWSPSIELLLRKAPETRLIVTIASGVLARESLTHPLVRLRRTAYDRQKLAEFVQVMRQMFTAHRFHLRPVVSFAPPVSLEELCAQAAGPGLRAAIIARARRQLAIQRALPVFQADSSL